MMSKTKIEALRGTWVRIQLSSGREYVGYFRKLRTEGKRELYSCGSSGPFSRSMIVRIAED